jgi:hypothetical protein
VLVCLVPGNVREKKDNLKPLERITEKPVYPLVVFGSMVLFDFESLFEKMLAFILCYKELICNEINIDFFFFNGVYQLEKILYYVCLHWNLGKKRKTCFLIVRFYFIGFLTIIRFTEVIVQL